MDSVRRHHLLIASFILIVSAPASAKKVSLGLYYESLCPYSADFIVNDLARIFNNGLISIIDLELVPYGNARVKSNGTITCQHGPYECLLNTIEACAIEAWPGLNEHFRFIYCVENLVLERKFPEWESCFENSGLDSNVVMDCFSSGYGKKLELKYAAQTDSLKPPHKYVPWVVVDGQPLYEDFKNFEAYICKAYGGDPPKDCEKLAVIQEMKAKQTTHLSYAENMIGSSASEEP